MTDKKELPPKGNILDNCCDTLLGLTGECNVIKNFLKEKPWTSKFLPLKVVDAILRGISQVVFASNPISGFLILVGLFTLCSPDEWNDKRWVCVGECVGGECVGEWEWQLGDLQCRGQWDWAVGLAVLACSAVALITATTYKQPLALVEDGITQFNAVLVGSVITNLYPALYGGKLDVKTWIFVLCGASATVIVQTALGNILASVKAPFLMKKSMGQQKTKTFGIVSLTLPFNIVCCIIMAVLVRTHVQGHDRTEFEEEEHLQVLPSFPHGTLKNVTSECVYKPNVTETDDIKWASVFVGAVRAMGEVYAVDTLRGSVLMYIGVAIFSPLLAVVEFTGALIGSYIALVVSPPPYDLVYAGVWGYCPLLTAGALGGFFVVLTPSSVPATILAIVSTAALQSFLIPILEVVRIPVFTIPFVLTTWIFLLLTTQNQTVVRADNITTPEGNMVTWRRENRATIAHFAHAFRFIARPADVHDEGVKEDVNSRTRRGV